MFTTRARRLAMSLLLAFGLAGCSGPTEFVSPLGPAGEHESDPRLLGAWHIVAGDTSQAWAKTEVFHEPDEDLPEGWTSTESGEHALEAFGLLIVPESEATVSAVGFQAMVSQTYPDEPGRTNGLAYARWAALSAHPTVLGGQTYYNVKWIGGASTGGDPDFAHFDHDATGSGYFVARVEITDDGKLRVRPVFSDEVYDYYRTETTDEDGETVVESNLPETDVACGWGCNMSVVDATHDDMLAILDEIDWDDPEKVFVFSRAPEEPARPEGVEF